MLIPEASQPKRAHVEPRAVGAFENRILGDSPPMRALLDRLLPIAGAGRATLIQGPTGTGKELVAEFLHERSPRNRAPLVRVNCAALPEALVDSELFGHKRGAFTGAASERVGLAGAAHGGTLFLDEVDSLAQPVQAKLLRFLETGEYRSVGNDRVRNADVWVLSATNRSLERCVAEGSFRQDLLYRLQVVHVDVPPLRARGPDVELLAWHFLRKTGAEGLRFTPDALAALRLHDWPGNVRELRNRVEQAAVLANGAELDRASLGLDGVDKTEGSAIATLPGVPRARPGDVMQNLWELVDTRGLSLGEAVELCERMIIEAALRSEDGNRTRAAHRLGIHVRTIFKKLHRFAGGG